MAAERHYTRLGFFVVVALVVAIATGLFFVERMRRRSVFELVTYTTENVSGHDVSSPVRVRGVPVGPVEIKDLPASSVFSPNRLVARNGLFYFASTTAGTVVVTDSSGRFREAIDHFALTNQEQEGRPFRLCGHDVFTAHREHASFVPSGGGDPMCNQIRRLQPNARGITHMDMPS